MRWILGKVWRVRRWILSRIIPEVVWPTERVIDGVPIKIRNAPYSFGVKRELSFRDTYEKPERELIREFIRPGMSVIEMGGSIGVLTSILGREIGSEGRLVSIEADSQLVAYSSTWITRMYPYVDVVSGFAFPVYQLPVGFRAHSLDTHGGSLSGKVSFSWSAELNSSEFDSNQVVNTFDLQKIQAIYAVSADVLVVDIEGSESVLSLTPANFPSSLKHLMIELHPWLYQDSDETTRRVIATIASEGFDLQRTIGSSYYFTR